MALSDHYIPEIGEFKVGDRVEWEMPTKFGPGGNGILETVHTHGYVFLCNDVHGGTIIIRHWSQKSQKYYPWYGPSTVEMTHRVPVEQMTDEEREQQHKVMIDAAEWYEQQYGEPYPYNHLIGRQEAVPPVDVLVIERYEQLALF